MIKNDVFLMLLVGILIFNNMACSSSKGDIMDPNILEARLISIVPSLESVPYQRVSLKFISHSANPVTVQSYGLSSNEISKIINVEPFTIPPGDSLVRSFKLYPDEGRLNPNDFKHVKINVSGKEKK